MPRSKLPAQPFTPRPSQCHHKARANTEFPHPCGVPWWELPSIPLQQQSQESEWECVLEEAGKSITQHNAQPVPAEGGGMQGLPVGDLEMGIFTIPEPSNDLTWKEP